MHPYKRFGESELAAISRQIENVASEWCHKLFGAAKATTSNLLEASQFRKYVNEHLPNWNVCSLDQKHIYVSFIDKWPEKLASERGWSGPSSHADPSSIWDRSVLKCIHSLALAVLASLANRGAVARLPPEVEFKNAKLNEEVFQTGSGYLVSQVGIGSAVLFLLIPPGTFEMTRSGPTLTGTKQKLVSRRSLLHDEKVILEVVAGSVVVTLGEIRNLSVGNVIKLESLIDEPISFRCHLGTVTGRGHLASIGGHKALQITKTLNQ